MSHGSRAILPPFVSYDQGKKHQLCSQTRLTNFWLLLTTMFSLWSFPQENVPNHYPQLFTLGWKLEGSNWLTNKKAFEKCAALCSIANNRLGLLKVKIFITTQKQLQIKFYVQARPNVSHGPLVHVLGQLCVRFEKKSEKVWVFFN